MRTVKKVEKRTSLIGLKKYSKGERLQEHVNHAFTNNKVESSKSKSK